VLAAVVESVSMLHWKLRKPAVVGMLLLEILGRKNNKHVPDHDRLYHREFRSGAALLPEKPPVRIVSKLSMMKE
jgi:hypothetical protein